MQPGQTYNPRATKEIVGNSVIITTYVNGRTYSQVKDTGQLGHGTPFRDRMGGCGKPIDQVRIDNWNEPRGNISRYLHCVSSGPFRG